MIGRNVHDTNVSVGLVRNISTRVTISRITIAPTRIRPMLMYWRIASTSCVARDMI